MKLELTSTQNGKLTQVTLGSAIIWFSYETPVAYAVAGVDGVIVSDKGWSVTTRRHIATIEDRRAPVAHAEFTAGLEAMLAKLTGPTDLEILDKRARALYDAAAGWREFARTFSQTELAKLATLCELKRDGSGGRAYDDEVFDALAAHVELEG